MEDVDGYFGEAVAATYDDPSGDEFDPAAIEAAVDGLAELDLMAQLAGLRLRERWGGRDRQPFSADSRGHVSVWEKPA